MAKERCQICGIEKAKRTCKIKDALQICPVCCAKLRYDQCAGCAYYGDSVRYQTEKPQRERHFVTPINPEIDEECDRILSAVESGHLSRGEELMRELYKKYPDYHTVLYGMGVCYVLQDKFEEAIEFFKRAVDIFPYFTEAHFNMAMAYIKLGDITGVVRGFREVIRVGGDEKLVSEARKRLGDLEKMAMELKGFNLDTYVDNSKIYSKAFADLQNREFMSAIDLFKRVLSTDPKHVQSWGNLGLAYAGIGERGKAIEYLDKALELDPEYEVAAVNRIAIKRLSEGERLEGEIGSVNYYRDYKVRGKKSYIAEIFQKCWKPS
ncbi:MAG: tetratricopeptide repeat protein [Deltaproteobacteria bacterium]|nr:tetratricopeptide repeat protein [Deltaproteobacteria bacterium]